ncbi:MAG: HD domain-containing protein [Lachnospiraceae bacterium]|nr:HD domain-containing protein [Lachnospiraceae bacterium]
MNYISSADIFRLVRDALSFINPAPMSHGSRVGYIMSRMLESQGKLEGFEIADIVMMSVFHDVGVYATDDVNDRLRYEGRDYVPHSAYGYLFLRNYSPLGDAAKPVLFHHMDYEQLSAMRVPEMELASQLNLAEKVDLYSTSLGDQFDLTMFHKMGGKHLSLQALDLMYQSANKYDLVSKIRSSEYKPELETALDYMLFTNSDKKKFMEMLVYVIGLKDDLVMRRTICCMSVAMQMCDQLILEDTQRDHLYYAAIVHDIGMIGLPDQPDEELLQTHITLMNKICAGRLSQKIVDIAAAHHERMDGTGYPKQLKNYQIDQEQKILQLADRVSELLIQEDPAYNPDRVGVMAKILTEADLGKLDRPLAETFNANYTEITALALKKVRDMCGQNRILTNQYQQLKEQYERKE